MKYDGEEYEGKFKRGQFHGKGKYSRNDGSQLKGNFIYGEYQGYAGSDCNQK